MPRCVSDHLRRKEVHIQSANLSAERRILLVRRWYIQCKAVHTHKEVVITQVNSIDQVPLLEGSGCQVTVPVPPPFPTRIDDILIVSIKAQALYYASWQENDQNHRRVLCVLICLNATFSIRKHFPFSHGAMNILRHCKRSAEDVNFSKSTKYSAKPVELRYGIRLRDAAVSRSAEVGHPVLPRVVYDLASKIKGRV